MTHSFGFLVLSLLAFVLHVQCFLVLPLLAFVLHVQSQEIWSLMKCRKCDRATSLEQCNEYIPCTKDEACYVDEIIPSAGQQVLFNAGCRSVAVCKIGAVQKRATDDLVACSRCCNGMDYCNEHLCGLGKETNQTRCNVCDGRDGRPTPPQYPEECSNVQPCEPSEVCFSSTIRQADQVSLSHYSTCMNRKYCETLTRSIFETYAAQNQGTVGKRDAGMNCAVCCGDELCNKNACETIKKSIRYLNNMHRFNITTMKEIPYTSSG